MTGNEFEFEHVDLVWLAMRGDNTSLTRSIDRVLEAFRVATRWELSSVMDGNRLAGQNSSEFFFFLPATVADWNKFPDSITHILTVARKFGERAEAKNVDLRPKKQILS